MTDFFIDRPIFATVIAVAIVAAGLIAGALLPVTRFPQITPPHVQVVASYPGAEADVVADVVITPIEEQINGAEGMIYMSSTSTAGGGSISVSFEVGRDVNTAAVDVQNRMQSALAGLPDTVQRLGLQVRKTTPSMTLIVNLVSPDGGRDDLYLSNYADQHLVDALKRVPGVGEIAVLGEKRYAMRIWLDPGRLAAHGLTAADVVAAVRDQNQQIAAGKLGQMPAPAGQTFEYQLTAAGRLEDVAEFEDIILPAAGGGAGPRLKDVARVELGAANYDWFSQFNGKASVTVGVFQLPGANALDVARAVRAEMDQIAEHFPAGVEYHIAYDTTIFVGAAISSVLDTLRDAILLVFIVVFVFLQTWRATVIPLIAIPVSLVGTLAALLALGFSINMLTMLGMVLAVGLVVDDAIVVVENTERRLRRGERTARGAAKAAMREVTGPIIATTAVLMVVFVPAAFIPGVTGKLYNQFALTIAVSAAISAFNSLTLSPALCAVFMGGGRGVESRFAPLRRFGAGFEALSVKYRGAVGWLVAHSRLVLALFAGCLALTGVLLARTPAAFLPDEDQGGFIVVATLPSGSALERTRHVTDRINEILLSTPGVASVVTVGGYNLLSGAASSNTAAAFVVLDPWDERAGHADQSAYAIIVGAAGRLQEIDEAFIVPLNAPSIPGLGAAGGFSLEVQDLNGAGAQALAEATQALIAAASQRPELERLFTSYAADTPQYQVDLDRDKAAALGLDISAIFNTLQIYLGSLYINDFNRAGRSYQVIAQAEEDARSAAPDVGAPRVRNRDGGMVPLDTLIQLHPRTGPGAVFHYNLYRSAPVSGSAAAGYSSGEALLAVAQTADAVLPPGFAYDWTGISYQEVQAGNAAPFIFGLALVFVFLFLAALYESWTMPFMILLSVPLAMLGALATLWATGFGLNVYSQIGLVILIGLAAKNSILLVEFARRRRAAGADILESAKDAARDRLRPILMTALAFILGVVPLFTTGGAGSAARASIGLTVFSGMITATALSLALTPVLYVLIQSFSERVGLAPVPNITPGK